MRNATRLSVGRMSSGRRGLFALSLVLMMFFSGQQQQQHHHSHIMVDALPELRSKYLSRTASATGKMTSTRRSASSSSGDVDYYSSHDNDSVVEMNPDYIYYTPPPPTSSSSPPSSAPSFNNEHDEWLRQQQQQQQQYSTSTTTNPYGNNQNSFVSGYNVNNNNNNNGSIFHFAKRYLQDLKQLSPSLFWTTISCVGIFILWGMPIDAPFLAKVLVCSRETVIATKGLSLLFAAVSHISFRHLLVNLVTLLHIGPSVKRDVLLLLRSNSGSGSSGSGSDIWPLLLGSAVASNAFFLAKPGGGACLGLSGVTMALIAVLGSAFPNRMFGIIVGVIPVRLQARHILQILLLVSALGSFAKCSNIAHMTHLGGLLYGLLYYELFLNNNNNNNNNNFRKRLGGRNKVLGGVL